ncbi:hypothetical protein CPAR01_15972 [Colletotrichum paranaense]|uniref:Uncharacterized protein n=1 Tax=Colletotrichum paranaense TaxID=1914294 RepID=A0ABQ9RXA5_9PEZI|nr:uncharacterized protein CPAR01_15972 [Colletotrichum paranaense]KAK1517492.1 hypothetical protein CPAR01_15972 [Colletotrichum paranaense]
MSDQQNPAPLKDPSNKESSLNAPGNQNPSIARLARSWGPYTPPDMSYCALEHDDPVLLENIKMLKELTSECDEDPTDLLDVVMRVPPRLSKSIVYLTVGLLQHQKLVENLLMVTELRAENDAGPIRNTKNGQHVKNGKKTKTKTRKLADIKEDNEDDENGGSMAPKGLEKNDQKNETKDNMSKAFGPAESNTVANTNHLAVPKSKRKKAKKQKAGNAIGIAESNPQLNTDQRAASLNTKTTAKYKSSRGSGTIESNAGAITKKSTVSKGKKVKAKENIDNNSKTVKNHPGANIKQQAITKNKNKMAKTNKKDSAAETHEQAKKTQPKSSPESSNAQNNNKVESSPKPDKGEKKANVSETTDGGFFSVLEIECMKKIQGRIERGIRDCQEVWTVVQKMEEATESEWAKDRKIQTQEQAECSAAGVAIPQQPQRRETQTQSPSGMPFPILILSLLAVSQRYSMQERRLYEADLPDHDDDDSDDGSASESSVQWATTLYATPEQLRNLPPLPLNNSNYMADNASISHPVDPVLDSPILAESNSEDSETGLSNAVFDDSDIDEAASDISEDSLADVVPDPRVLEAIAPAGSERNPIVIKSARIITRMRARIAENPANAIQERRNAIETIGEIFPLRLLTYGGGLFTPFQPLGVWHEDTLLSDINASLALELAFSRLVEWSDTVRALRDLTRQLTEEVSDEEYITAEEFLTDEEDYPRELRIEIIEFVAREVGFIAASTYINRYHLYLLETLSYRPHLIIATLCWATALALLFYLFFAVRF